MSRSIHRLLEIMALLRDPERGCPWDVEQSFATIAPYTIEEAYEVADAIERGDIDALREELGDLLLQVVYHAQMAGEARLFDFEAVVDGICTKLVSRHPHVFGDAEVAGAAAQTAAWEHHKAEERARKSSQQPRNADAAGTTLDGLPVALPALTRAHKLQRRAARVGFDWHDAKDVLEKFSEEIDELAAELNGEADLGRLEEEVGDLLFTCVNAARKLDIGRVGMWRGGVRIDLSVSAPFVWRCLSSRTMTPFPHPAHRTGRADFPHPALGQNLTPSPTARRAQAGSGVRARSARKGARVDMSRPCVA